MRNFLDFEFIENGDLHPIIPISVGIVREDEAEYYAEFNLTDKELGLANKWVLNNVMPNLTGITKSKTQIKDEIFDFVGYKPEFWAYYADYDWVTLCSLYGPMVSKPQSWPSVCLDIIQYMYHAGVSFDDIEVPTNEAEHNALADAKWDRALFHTVMNHIK